MQYRYLIHEPGGELADLMRQAIERNERLSVRALPLGEFELGLQGERIKFLPVHLVAEAKEITLVLEPESYFLTRRDDGPVAVAIKGRAGTRSFDLFVNLDPAAGDVPIEVILDDGVDW